MSVTHSGFMGIGEFGREEDRRLTLRGGSEAPVPGPVPGQPGCYLAMTASGWPDMYVLLHSLCEETRRGSRRSLVGWERCEGEVNRDL